MDLRGSESPHVLVTDWCQDVDSWFLMQLLLLVERTLPVFLYGMVGPVKGCRKGLNDPKAKSANTRPQLILSSTCYLPYNRNRT